MAELVRHPAFPPRDLRSVEARIVSLDATWLRVRWRLFGVGSLVVPAFGGKGRADGLWKTTCFEMFLLPGDGPAYCEFNLSPSERWNVYDFAARREGMAERPMPREPECGLRLGTDLAIFDAAIPAAGLPSPPWRYGLAAVVEERAQSARGTFSYWAAAHGDEKKPDFHDPACFTQELAAPPSS